MKFCSAVLEEQRIRKWGWTDGRTDGRTNERTDGQTQGSLYTSATSFAGGIINHFIISDMFNQFSMQNHLRLSVCISISIPAIISKPFKNIGFEMVPLLVLRFVQVSHCWDSIYRPGAVSFMIQLTWPAQRQIAREKKSNKCIYQFKTMQTKTKNNLRVELVCGSSWIVFYKRDIHCQ